MKMLHAMTNITKPFYGKRFGIIGMMGMEFDSLLAALFAMLRLLYFAAFIGGPKGLPRSFLGGIYRPVPIQDDITIPEIVCFMCFAGLVRIEFVISRASFSIPFSIFISMIPVSLFCLFAFDTDGGFPISPAFSRIELVKRFRFSTSVTSLHASNILSEMHARQGMHLRARRGH